MEEGDVVCGQRKLRNGLNLCNVLVDEYHSRPENYKDVKIRFEDGTVLESSRLILGSLSELLFESLGSIPSWEEAEILAPGLDSSGLRLFLEGVLGGSSSEESTKEGDEHRLKEVIKTFGFDTPPRIDARLKAYYCEDCDVYTSKNEILSHVREAHPKGRSLFSSPIWSYFEATEHPDFHQCRECKNVIKDKSSNSSALIRHLEMQHPDSYEEFLSQVGVNDTMEVTPDPMEMSSRGITGITPPSKKVNRRSLEMVPKSLDKRRSMIWKYFTPPLNSFDYSSCHACMMTFKGPPSSLIRHLKSIHPELYADYAQSTLMVIRESIGCSEEGGESIEERVSTDMPNANEVVRQELRSKYSSLGFLFERSTSNGFYCKICSSSHNLNLKSASDMIEHLKLEHSSLYSELNEICFEKDHQREGGKVEQERTDVSEDDEHGSEDEKVYDSEDEALRKSKVWLHFEPTEVDGLYSCNICSGVMNCKKNPASVVFRHMKMAHPKLYIRIKKLPVVEDPVSEEEVSVDEGDYHYMADLFSHVEDVRGLRECKACLKTFREDNILGQVLHIKKEHPKLYETEFSRTTSASVPYIISKQRNKRRSFIWKYFDTTNIEGENSCKTCKKVFKCKGKSTSSMISHLKFGHKEIYDEFIALTDSFNGKKIGVPLVNHAPPVETQMEVLENEAPDPINEEEEANMDEGDYHYVADLFSPVEHVRGLKECKACLKTFREDHILGQVVHIKKEHPKLYETELNRTPGEGIPFIITKPKNTSKRRSFIWKYFDTTNIEGENCCKTCKKVFKCKGQSTSSMIRHLKFGHKEIYEQFFALTESFSDRKIRVPLDKYASPIETQMEVLDNDAPPSAETETEIQDDDDNTPSDEMEIKGPGIDTLSEEEPTTSSSSAVPQYSPNVSSGRKRSSIWNYFVTTNVPDTNACKICHNVFRCKSQSTTSMIRHLMKKHLESFNEYLRFKGLPREVQSKTVDESELKSLNPIWSHYTKCKEDPKWGECNQCDKKVKIGPERGKVPSLIHHLEVDHPDSYEAYLISGGRTESEELSQTCRECGDKFPNRSSLREHSKSAHPKIGPYKCDECDATFTRRNLFEAHTHGEERPRNFLCIVCGKTFARRSIRDFHEKAHKNEKNYQCGYCPKKFLTNQRKYKHERTHTGERPYQCTECGRQFSQSHHLVTHSRIHTGQKPYTCNFCPQRFRHLSSRNNHKCEGKLSEGGSQTGNSSQ